MDFVDDTIMFATLLRLHCWAASLGGEAATELWGEAWGWREGGGPHWIYLSLLFLQGLCKTHGSKHTLHWRACAEGGRDLSQHRPTISAT